MKNLSEKHEEWEKKKSYLLICAWAFTFRVRILYIVCTTQRATYRDREHHITVYCGLVNRSKAEYTIWLNPFEIHTEY